MSNNALKFYHSFDPTGFVGAYYDLPDYGGMRSTVPIPHMFGLVSNPIPNILIEDIGGEMTEGDITVQTVDVDTVRVIFPDATISADTELVLNTSTMITEAAHYTGKYIVLRRTSSANFQGDMTVQARDRFAGPIGMANLSYSGTLGAIDNQYRGLYLYNDAATDLTNVTLTVPRTLLGTTSVAQLGASGAGTITVGAAMPAATPASGYAYVYKDASNTEIVYYTSRTSTSLTVAAAGRALFGTTSYAGTASDTVSFQPGIMISAEAPSVGTISTQANGTTAPTSPTWVNTFTIATLAAGASYGLRIWRQCPTNIRPILTGYSNEIDIAFTTGGQTYSDKIIGKFHAKDTALRVYSLYVGAGTTPDFAAAPAATSATLPFSYVQALPVSRTTYQLTVRDTSDLGLQSQNIYTRNTTMNTDGTVYTPSLTSPTDITLTDNGNGECRINAKYNPALDTNPADYWRMFITTDGTSPDPATTTPTDVVMDIGNGMLPGNSLGYTFYAGNGVTVKAIVRAYHSMAVIASSDNTAIVSVAITSTRVLASLQNWGFYGENQGANQRVNTPVTTVTLYTGVYLYTLYGETGLISTIGGVKTTIFRAVYEDATHCAFYLNPSIAMVNANITGAGAATPFQVVSATEIYLCVNGQRVAKFDLSAMTFSASTFVSTTTLTANTQESYFYQTPTALYLLAFDASTGSSIPFLCADSGGTINWAIPVQEQLG